MNKNLLITSAITAGAAALYYLVKRKMRLGSSVTQMPQEHSRHITNVFSKAKNA